MRISTFCRLSGVMLVTSVLLSCSNDDDVLNPNQPASVNMLIQELSTGLANPWGMAFLPDGRMLVTERSGQLRILELDNTLSQPIAGIPEVFVEGQAGLLDVAIDPDFANNQLVYLSYAELDADGTPGTALGRGVLTENGIENFTTLFSQYPKVNGNTHFGGRILFDQGHLFLTLGDRFQLAELQSLSVHYGTIVRIHPDGSIPADNPFVNEPGALPEIWTLGHRNVQGAAIDPATGFVWVSEMGPLHGDELNLIESGENYGWPEVSWGDNYDQTPIPDHDTQPGFAAPATWWNPSIAPSGMTFYTASMFPDLQGKLLIGGLQAAGIVVVEVNGSTAQEMDRIALSARIRDVEQAPDGSIYVITDEANGRVIRLVAE